MKVPLKRFALKRLLGDDDLRQTRV